MRGVGFIGGAHDMSIVRGGAVVYPRLIAAEHGADFDHTGVVGSGVPALDTLLGGGVPRGTSTLIVGPAGSGKSTLVSLYAHTAALRGERASLFHFEENAEIFLARSKSIGLDLRAHCEAGLVKFRQVDPAELSPSEFADHVRRSVEVDGARIVGIDSLNGYLNAMPDERALTLQLHELLTTLSSLGVATFLVMAQHGLVGSAMAAPVDVSYVADNVLMTRYFEHDGVVHKALSVIKKRSGLHESTIRELQLTPKGVVVGEPLRQFRGVLTGVPVFEGEAGRLMTGSR
jgi:circadian clock protein KaiC